MFDPFAAAARALFAAPGSAAAVYQPNGGEPIALRVIRTDADVLLEQRGARTVQGALRFELPREKVAAPKQGDRFAIGGTIVAGEIVGGERFAVFGEPMLDAEGVSWAIGAEPA